VWLLSNSIATDYEHAVLIGSALMAQGVIQHVTFSKPFANDNFFYHLYDLSGNKIRRQRGNDRPHHFSLKNSFKKRTKIPPKDGPNSVQSFIIRRPEKPELRTWGSDNIISDNQKSTKTFVATKFLTTKSVASPSQIGSSPRVLRDSKTGRQLRPSSSRSADKGSHNLLLDSHATTACAVSRDGVEPPTALDIPKNQEQQEQPETQTEQKEQEEQEDQEELKEPGGAVATEQADLQSNSSESANAGLFQVEHKRKKHKDKSKKKRKANKKARPLPPLPMGMH